MKLSRRLVIAGGAMMSVFLVPGCGSKDTEGEASASPTVPSDWESELIEPLAIKVPDDLTPWSQSNGSSTFYWDRAWATVPEDLGGSTVLLVRLWGPGATQDASASEAVQSLAQLTGADPVSGDVSDLGGGSWWQPLTASAAKGAVWDLTNGASRAVVVLLGPEVTDAFVASVGAGLVMDSEPELPVPEAGWQRRQAGGVSVAVGATWNDIGQPEGDEAGVWQRGWTSRVDDITSPSGAVMVGANLAGASVTEAVAALLVKPGVTALRDTVTTPFTSTTVQEGQRVDFTWGNGVSNAGSLWAARSDTTIDGVMYLHWAEADDAYVAARTTIESSIAAV